MNSYTEINLTKLDILDTFPEIKVDRMAGLTLFESVMNRSGKIE